MHPQDPDPYSLILFQRETQEAAAIRFILAIFFLPGLHLSMCVEIAPEITRASHNSVMKKSARISTPPCIIQAAFVQK